MPGINHSDDDDSGNDRGKDNYQYNDKDIDNGEEDKSDLSDTAVNDDDDGYDDLLYIDDVQYIIDDVGQNGVGKNGSNQSTQLERRLIDCVIVEKDGEQVENEELDRNCKSCDNKSSMNTKSTFDIQKNVGNMSSTKSKYNNCTYSSNTHIFFGDSDKFNYSSSNNRKNISNSDGGYNIKNNKYSKYKKTCYT